MIFATVGHTHMPFTRFMDALSELSSDYELVVQHGPAPPPPNAAVTSITCLSR